MPYSGHTSKVPKFQHGQLAAGNPESLTLEPRRLATYVVVVVALIFSVVLVDVLNVLAMRAVMNLRVSPLNHSLSFLLFLPLLLLFPLLLSFRRLLPLFPPPTSTNKTVSSSRDGDALCLLRDCIPIARVAGPAHKGCMALAKSERGLVDPLNFRI